MKTIRRIAAAVLFAVGATFVAAPSTAQAGMTTGNLTSDPATSRRNLASFNGTASYDSVTQKLTITLNNTTGKGFLTGFAFNANSPMTAVYADGNVAGTKKDEDSFDQIKKRPKPAKNIKPWGRFVAGATLDGRWNSEAASRGVAAGGSHTFTFDVLGVDDGATIADIFKENPLTLIAKFRGLQGKKKHDQVGARMQVVSAEIVTPPINLEPSDNVPTIPGGDTDPNPVVPVITTPTNPDDGLHAVPLPPAAWGGLAMLGLTTVAGLRKKFARAIA